MLESCKLSGQKGNVEWGEEHLKRWHGGVGLVFYFQ